MMRRFLTFFLYLVVTAGVAAYAQIPVEEPMEAPSDTVLLNYTVRGRVLDSRSGRALEAAHVKVPGRHYATVTNEDGAFVLRSDTSITEVECSYLGYKTATVPIGRGPTVIRLKLEDTYLPESFVISGSPEAIVEEAIHRIWDTYCTEPELLECFYRETLQKKGRYTYVAEAVATLYKDTYNGAIWRDAAALEKSRVLVSQRRTDTLSVKTQGGPTQAITLDAVKNNDLIFNKQDMELYEYRMEAPASIDGRQQIVISFSPEGETDYPLYYGLLYIDREFLTFTRIELSMDMSDKAKAANAILVRKPFSLRFYPEEVSIVINYRFSEGRSRLEYLRTTLRFDCDWKKRLFRTHYVAVNELVVTDVRERASIIPKARRFKVKDILSDKAAEFLDPDFWEGYNIIAPSESLEHAIGKLRRRR